MNFQKYKPNPDIIIEAYKWVKPKDINEALPSYIKVKYDYYGELNIPSNGIDYNTSVPMKKIATYYIETLEGKMIISDGDYICRGIEGEFYPCKPNIFEKKYVPTK